MENLPRISVIVLFTLFFAGIAFADVDRVSGTLVAVTDVIRDVSPVITMTCLIISALLYSSCNLNMGSEIRKQFVLVAQGFLTISVVAVTLSVVIPPVVGTVYGLPPNSCVYGCSASDCNPSAGVCCPDGNRYCGISLGCLPVPACPP